MYKTIRNLLPTLLLTLCTACTNDPADNPADTGLPLVLENVYIGTPTKAEPYEPGFADGSMLEATIALDGVTTGGTYVYQDGQWTSDATAYWQNTTEAHDVTLRTPEPKDDMPAAFTQDNWHEYDLLEYSQTTTATTTFSLTHTRAQFCVALEKGDGMSDDELAAATVTANSIGMLHTDGAHYALFDPGTKIASVNIDINGSTYTYTPDTDITLEKGKCTILTLKVNKVGVSGITVSGEDWKDVTGTVTEAEGWNTHTGGNIDPSTLTGKVMITGTLSSEDMSTLFNARDQISELYITATVDNNAWQSFNMRSSISLRSVYLAQFTQLWMLTFNNCKALTTVSLPKVTSIDGEAFSGCTSLTTVYLPKITNIAYSIFDGCSSLKEITLSKSTNINESPSGQGAFADCTALTTLRLPDLDAADFNEDTYASFGGVDWQHIYYNGGAWHRDENN